MARKRIVETRDHDGKRYELTAVTCGKANCGKCPHGPYWYVRIPIGGRKTITRYIGKQWHAWDGTAQHKRQLALQKACPDCGHRLHRYGAAMRCEQCGRVLYDDNERIIS